jgi:hypothetical protein
MSCQGQLDLATMAIVSTSLGEASSIMGSTSNGLGLLASGIGNALTGYTRLSTRVQLAIRQYQFAQVDSYYYQSVNMKSIYS